MRQSAGMVYWTMLISYLLIHTDLARSTPANCYHPPSPGSCDGEYNKFYFDKWTGRCQHFYYSGCDGNENQFDTLPECIEACIDDDEESKSLEASSLGVCKLPPYRGPSECKAHQRMYTFRKVVGKCEEFLYNGCKKSGNVFNSLGECQEKCLGLRSRSLDTQPQLTVQVKSADFCFQEPLLEIYNGLTCRANFKMWTFDGEVGECKSITYGGCGASANMFESLSECNEFCYYPVYQEAFANLNSFSLKSSSNEFCGSQQVYHASNCHANVYQFFKRNQTNCWFFEVSGCDALINIFDTKNKCNKICDRTNFGIGLKLEDTFMIEFVVGNCKAEIKQLASKNTKSSCYVHYYDVVVNKALLTVTNVLLMVFLPAIYILCY